MHSEIFEIQTPEDRENGKVTPVGEGCLDEFCYYEHSFGDYYSNMDVDEQQECVESFLNDLSEAFEVKGQTVFITDEGVMKFLKRNFDSFKSEVDDLTLEKFSGVGDNTLDIYRIEVLLNDKYDIHIWYNNCDYTLSEFLRYERGEFDVVNCLDYHY